MNGWRPRKVPYKSVAVPKLSTPWVCISGKSIALSFAVALTENVPLLCVCVYEWGKGYVPLPFKVSDGNLRQLWL